MGGNTGGSVAERFYGYRLGGVTGNEVENTKNWEDESPKHRPHASMKCACGFMKGTGLTPHEQSHTVKGVRQHAKAVGASIWPRKDITFQTSAPNFLATGRETHYVFDTEHRRAIPTPGERLG